MSHLSIDIPDDVLQAMKLPLRDAPVRLRTELALRLYEKGILSLGKARKLSSLSRWEFHEQLGQQGILRRYDVQELEEDLDTLESLL
jgi:predicted HTH domain antitoxin